MEIVQFFLFPVVFSAGWTKLHKKSAERGFFAFCGFLLHRLRFSRQREQELLILLRVHIFARDEDAWHLDEVRSLLAGCDLDRLLHSYIAHIERPLRHDRLNDVLFEKRDLPLRIIAADDKDLSAHAKLDQRVRRADVADLVRADKAADVRGLLQKLLCKGLRAVGAVVAAEAAEDLDIPGIRQRVDDAARAVDAWRS